MEMNICISLSETICSVVNMEPVRMEMDVCISLPENIGFLVNMEDVRLRQMHSIGVSENIFFSVVNIGRYQDGDGYAVLAFPKTLSPSLKH